MRKLVAVLFTAGLLAGASTTIASASPGPNGHNNHGLCTAYYNGSQTGRDHKHQAGPFRALEDAADQAGNDDGTATADEVASFCDGLVGGNPAVRS